MYITGKGLECMNRSPVCVCVHRCDADPVALAKYVVALLRKDKPKAALKELCIEQLEVFLAKGAYVYLSNTSGE